LCELTDLENEVKVIFMTKLRVIVILRLFFSGLVTSNYRND